jgi:hypothetical protein
VSIAAGPEIDDKLTIVFLFFILPSVNHQPGGTDVPRLEEDLCFHVRCPAIAACTDRAVGPTDVDGSLVQGGAPTFWESCATVYWNEVARDLVAQPPSRWSREHKPTTSSHRGLGRCPQVLAYGSAPRYHPRHPSGPSSAKPGRTSSSPAIRFGRRPRRRADRLSTCLPSRRFGRSPTREPPNRTPSPGSGRVQWARTTLRVTGTRWQRSSRSATASVSAKPPTCSR